MDFFLNTRSNGSVISSEQQIETMKKLLSILAITLISIVLFPEQAFAGHGHSGSGYTYRSSYSTCGCPLYKRRVIASYDCYRRPVYRYYSVPIVHRCRTYRAPAHRAHYSYGHRRSYSSHYRRPSHYSGHRSRGTHISYSGRYGSIRICR